MWRFFYITYWIAMTAGLLQAQQPGLLVADERYLQVPLLPVFSGVKYTEVPVKMSLKKYCPVPGDQRQTGACVGWAVGYGALTIQNAIQQNLTDKAGITQQAYSAAFIYNQIRKNIADCTDGAYLEDALELVKQHGDCLEKSFNYQEFDCDAQPTPAHQTEAGQYKIQDFAAIFALNEDPKTKIGKTCKILATQTPIIAGIGITPSFFEVLPGATEWNPDAAESLSGYHAMVVVGYNNVDKYVELLNSFGPSWGQNGFIRLPYDDFERLCRYAYIMVPSDRRQVQNEPSPQTPVPAVTPGLSGAFVFRRPVGFVENAEGEELMFFEEVKTRLAPQNAGFYETEKSEFQPGDVFQLVAKEIPKGRYVYIFSQSPDGSVNLHFPRKKTEMNPAGFVLDPSAEIVIPGEESLLQIPAPGEDYLCILYAFAPVRQFEQRLAQLEKTEADFSKKIQATFGDVLIPSKNIQFSPDKMSFSAVADPDGSKIAVALMLVVKAK